MVENPEYSLKKLVREGRISLQKFVNKLNVDRWVSENDDIGAAEQHFLLRIHFNNTTDVELRDLIGCLFSPDELEFDAANLQSRTIRISEPGDERYVWYDTEHFTNPQEIAELIAARGEDG